MTLTQDEILGVLRHLLTSGGGALVTAGYVTNTQLTDATGALMMLVGIAWSIAQKRWAKASPQSTTGAQG